jgi:hypothetical protein
VYRGGSLLIWYEAFPNALITGVDKYIRPDTLVLLDTKRNRVRLKELDAYAPHVLESAFEDEHFDIIIDDGAHSLHSQLFAVSHFPDMLTPTGILVIESIQSEAWIPLLLDAVNPQYRSCAYVINKKRHTGRYDDMLFIIDRSLLFV